MIEFQYSEALKRTVSKNEFDANFVLQLLIQAFPKNEFDGTKVQFGSWKLNDFF